HSSAAGRFLFYSPDKIASPVMKLPAFGRFMVNQTFLSMKASFGFHSPGVQLGMVNKCLVDEELNAQPAAKRAGTTE
ncbi:MAG: hypothetical protein AAGA89_07575, partial [Pseudomonadota bacterium]